jgi:hypothetical protein
MSSIKDTTFDKALKHLTEQVILYRTTDVMDCENLSKILQQLTGVLFYLEKVRADFHDKWQSKVNEQVLGGTSVSRAENVAHVEYPQMYMLRRVMDSGYQVVNAIRSQLSYAKGEREMSKA